MDSTRRIKMGLGQIVSRAPILIVIGAFLFNTVIPTDLAWAKKTDTMPSPIGEDKSVGPGQLLLLGPHDIDIPPAFGTIKERFQQDKEPKGLIVHIQDLHTHYEAHRNIAGIIEYLNRKHNINVVLCEAKETDRGFAYLRPWTYQEVREKVAEDNLKKGLLTGWEALDLTSDLDLVLQGIEDKRLYMKDMDAFLSAETFRQDALKFTEVLKNIAANLKLHMYSGPQKAFDEKMGFYREEKIGIADYSTHLTKLAQRHNIDHKDLRNLTILLETLDLEKRIDFKKAEREREDLIELLAKRLLEDEMKRLLDMSMKFKANRISQHEFYQYLISVAKKSEIETKPYPNLNLYVGYIASYHNLDASKLFEEINNLENLIAEAIFKKEDQRRLFEISKNLIILKGLVDFKLTPDEFDYYINTKSGFDIKSWLGFLKINSEYFKLSQYVPNDSSIIEDNIPILENFYKVAHERDDAFVKNIEKQFTERKIQTAFLMTGGFHTPGVMARLKDAGYSYIVISPRIEEEMDYQKYHKILKESYRKLKDTTVIGPFSVIESEANYIFNEVYGYGGMRFATEEEQRTIFEGRQRLAILTHEGEAIISNVLRGEENRALLGEVLAGISALRAYEIQRMMIRRGEEEGRTVDYRERGRLHEVIGDTTYVILRTKGPLAVWALGPGGEGLLAETETPLAPAEGLKVERETMPQYMVPPGVSLEAAEVVGKVVPIETIISHAKRGRIIADEARGEVTGKFARDTDYVVPIEVTTIAGTLDEAKRRKEEIAEYLGTFVAENMYEWRKTRAPVYFDIIGTEEEQELANYIRGIYYGLAVVRANSELMKLYREVTVKNINKQIVSISHRESRMPVNNPKIFVEGRILTPEGLNIFDWDLSFLAALRISLETKPIEEIGKDLLNEATNYAKLRTILARLFKINRGDITSQHISSLYDYSQPDYVARLISQSLYIKKIQAVNFEEMRRIHEMMKEVQLSI